MITRVEVGSDLTLALPHPPEYKMRPNAYGQTMWSADAHRVYTHVFQQMQSER